MKLNIGDTLKKIRNDKKLSIRDLAKKAKISPTSLSNIERNINSPSLDSLSTICDALGIHMVDLLMYNEESDSIITRVSDRRELSTSGESKISYEFISPSKKEFKMLKITMDPHCDYGYTVQNFPSDEIGLVVQGQLEITIEGKTIILNTGDSIYLKANSQYKYRNLSDSQCISLWAIQGRM